ncbi:MAG: putative restriction endonuclease [Actinomycetota bacterium]|nr:putative restriction endonuclease [Actinomycetota bacterium]
MTAGAWYTLCMDADGESRLREQIMHRLMVVTARNGGSITRGELAAFDLGDGRTRRLIDHSRGIWNPRDLSATLAIVSSPDGPYADEEVDGGLLRYDYRAGTDAGDNTKLRVAAELGLPLILLRKIDTGVYVPVFPVYAVDDDRANRRFLIALDEGLRFLRDPRHLTEDQRRYARRIARQRLHQPEFRGRVIRAYGTSCTICSLRHGELLDAAHIVPDSHQTLGQPVVRNGLSLCKIHHAAFDEHLLGITPDYEVRINADLLDEVDGPMLKHGLQEMHGQSLHLPAARRDWPDRDRLAHHWDDFLRAS